MTNENGNENGYGEIRFHFHFYVYQMQKNVKEIREIAGRKACNTNGFPRFLQLMQ